MSFYETLKVPELFLILLSIFACQFAENLFGSSFRFFARNGIDDEIEEWLNFTIKRRVFPNLQNSESLFFG